MHLLLQKHSQKIQYSQKQYLKTYFFACKEFMLETMLRQESPVVGEGGHAREGLG